jgi:hypothetical protein
VRGDPGVKVAGGMAVGAVRILLRKGFIDLLDSIIAYIYAVVTSVIVV